MTLSVIVPVYNAEKYLDECVQSILDQTAVDLEVILVDDGSPDNCPAMCDEWAAKDSRVKVIHKANAGQSRARQAGVYAASGQFVAFVDSDDKIDKDMYSTMLSVQKQNDYDYVICGLKRFFDDSDDVRFEPAGDYALNNKAEIFKRMILPMIYPLQGESVVSHSAAKILLKKNILLENNIEFRSLKEFFSEDLLFNVEYLMCCENAVSIPDTFYSYRANPNSFSQTIRTDESKLKSISNTYYFLLDLFGNDADVKNRISIKCLDMLSVYLRHLVKNTGFSSSVSKIKSICRDNDIQTMMGFDYPQLSLKNKIMQFLISGKHNFMLAAMITVYNKVYIRK